MKKLLLLLCCVQGFAVRAQEIPETYTANFKTIFEAAQKYYKTDKAGPGTALATTDFVMEYPCKSTFKGAVTSRLVADKDGILNHQAIFDAGKTLEGAQVLLKALAETTKPLLPANFKESKSVNMRYADQSGVTQEFNSDDFSQIAKRPTVIMGVTGKEGAYQVEVLIVAPAFNF